jgi:hypothetical protein
MSAPVPGAVPVYPVAWSGRSGGNYDPPQGGGWILPNGQFWPYPPREKK